MYDPKRIQHLLIRTSDDNRIDKTDIRMVRVKGAYAITVDQRKVLVSKDAELIRFIKLMLVNHQSYLINTGKY